MPAAASEDRIAVVTADNAGYENAGMVTVDLAFESIRKRLDPDLGVEWFTLHLPSVSRIRPYVRESDLPFRFQRLEDPGPARDLRVIWGDFLQTRHYIEQDATIKLLRRSRVTDRGQARDLLHRLLLLRDEPREMLQRTVLYGGTILHNTQSDYLDSEYHRAFSRLVVECHSIWLRDPISLPKPDTSARPADRPSSVRMPPCYWIQPRSPGSSAPDGPTKSMPEQSPASSSASGPRRRRGCRDSARRSLPARTFGSSGSRGRRRNHRISCGSTCGPAPAMLGDLLAALPRYRFIITDTYHLCVNAWRVGTPAVCIAAPQPGRSPDGLLSLNDWKKHVFYDPPTKPWISTWPPASTKRK